MFTKKKEKIKTKFNNYQKIKLLKNHWDLIFLYVRPTNTISTLLETEMR